MQLTVAEDGSATFMTIEQDWSIDASEEETLLGRLVVLYSESADARTGSGAILGRPVCCGAIN